MRGLTTYTTRKNDDPNHLELRFNALPAHQMALIASGCAPFRVRVRPRDPLLCRHHVLPGLLPARVLRSESDRRTLGGRVWVAFRWLWVVFRWLWVGGRTPGNLPLRTVQAAVSRQLPRPMPAWVQARPVSQRLCRLLHMRRDPLCRTQHGLPGAAQRLSRRQPDEILRPECATVRLRRGVQRPHCVGFRPRFLGRPLRSRGLRRGRRSERGESWLTAAIPMENP